MLLRDDSSTAPDFHVWLDRDRVPPVVNVFGDLDLVTCAALRDALSDAAARADVIVVDMRHVTFLGSTGIRELLRALDTVERIEVRSPAPIARRALGTVAIRTQLVITDE